jgi:hypothetical protein
MFPLTVSTNVKVARPEDFCPERQSKEDMNIAEDMAELSTHIDETRFPFVRNFVILVLPTIGSLEIPNIVPGLPSTSATGCSKLETD